jgi:hypothetical protein
MLNNHADIGDDNHVTDVVRVLDEDENAGAKEFLHCGSNSEGDGSELGANGEHILGK